jgi:hypothetical protein
MYWLTEEQMESVAALNVINAVALAFLGISMGAAISFYTSVRAGNLAGDTLSLFQALEASSWFLSLFLACIVSVGFILSCRKMRRIKTTRNNASFARQNHDKRRRLHQQDMKVHPRAG